MRLLRSTPNASSYGTPLTRLQQRVSVEIDGEGWMIFLRSTPTASSHRTSLTTLNKGYVWRWGRGDLMRLPSSSPSIDHHNELSILTHSKIQSLWFALYLLGWKYGEGFVNEEMIRDHLPAAADDILVFMCGPPPMIEFACNPNLKKLGFSTEQRFAY